MLLSKAVNANSDLDFGVILDGLLTYPEAYVNFGKYWWTLKRMMADWAEENGADVDPERLRGSHSSQDAAEVDEGEVYRFLDQFSGKDDFMDWISYVNPMMEWDELGEEGFILEDLEWEENFL